jgi:elongation factor G
MTYATDKIRNIALLGHGSNGKTSLAESMLYLTGGIDRLGKITDGNTVGDSGAEEITRQISISLATMYAEHNNCKINILDTPGYFDFAGEAAEALRVADGGVIVCSAKDGVTVGFEKSWKYLENLKLPCAIYVSKIDEEHGDFESAYGALREKYGSSVCPMVAPIKNANGKVEGLVDLISKKAFTVEGGKRREIPVPDSMSAQLEELYGALSESVAETDEELMEKYFSGEAFTVEEVIAGIKSGVKDRMVYPVFCGCALTGLGTLELLDAVVNLVPSPLDAREEIAEDGSVIAADPNGPTCAIVYKTLSDQYGKFSFFKVLSGKVTPDMSLLNARTGSQEKIAHIYSMRGKKSVGQEVVCGDIGAVSKLGETKTGDTLCDPKKPVTAKGINFAPPCYAMAIAPKTKGQEDKIASGLARLSEEDLTFTFVNNAETKQLVLSGAGDIQLDVLSSKLKERFGVEVELSPARIAYREKIRKKVQARGRHKKQSGGHGQFGDVIIDFEPGEEQDLVFTENVFGGSVPKNFFPAVEKGLRDSIQKGVLAGYPRVQLKATLVDGSYHPSTPRKCVQTAAQLPTRRHPAGEPRHSRANRLFEVTIPDTYKGDIMSDLSKRAAARWYNLDAEGNQVVEAEVPMARCPATPSTCFDDPGQGSSRSSSSGTRKRGHRAGQDHRGSQGAQRSRIV